MQLNRNQIIEINLKDLFFHILYRWRSILIAALIGALLLCGYQYLSIKKIHDAGKLTKEERQYQIDLQQYREDLASNRNAIDVYSKLIQEQNDYLNESIYIKLSPQNVWVASNKYLIKVDQSVHDVLPQGSTIDQADSILPLYAAPLSEITDEDALKKAFETDKIEYISELVTTITKTEDNTVTVYVLGDTKEMAQNGISLLHQQMEKLATGKAQTDVKYQLVLASENISRGITKELSGIIDLADKQQALAKTTEENQETLQKARQKLDKLEADGEPKEPGYHLVKMAVIGFILGAIILMFIYAIHYVLDGRLHNSRDISERYKLPIFGEFATSGRIHSNKGLDRLLTRCELGKEALTDDVIYDNISALINKKKEDRNILIVSTLPAEKVKTVKDALEKRLLDKQIGAQADLTHNSEAISKASEADAVIIVEAKNISRMKDIDRMAENLIISEAKVIGAIML